MLGQQHRNAQLPVDALDGIKKDSLPRVGPAYSSARREISSFGFIAITDARFSICFCPPDSSLVFFRNQGSIPKERRHLGNSSSNDLRRKGEVFQTERQLMPHEIRYDLIFRILLDITTSRKRRFGAQFIDGCILIENLPLAAARRAKLLFCLF